MMFQDTSIPASDILDLSTCASYNHHIYNMMQSLKSLLLILLQNKAKYVHNNTQTKCLALIPNIIQKDAMNFQPYTRSKGSTLNLPQIKLPFQKIMHCHIEHYHAIITKNVLKKKISKSLISLFLCHLNFCRTHTIYG